MMGWHIGHSISHAFHSATHAASHALDSAVHAVVHPVSKLVSHIPVIGKPISKVINGVEHTIGVVNHLATSIGDSAINVVTHPGQTLKSAIGDAGHLVDDISHGRFMHSLQDIGHLADEGHLWHTTTEAFEDLPMSQAIAKGWHQVERPINRELANAIKKATGHNVFGSHPLQSVAEIAATIASMGGYSVVGGITAGLESLAGTLGATAAEGGITGALASIGSELATFGAEAGYAFQTAESLVESVPGMLGGAINDAARAVIPGLAPVEDWAANTATSAAQYFEKGVTAIGGQNKVTNAINGFIDKEVGKVTSHLTGQQYTGFGGSMWTENPIEQVENSWNNFASAVKQGWDVGGSIQGTTAVQHFRGELGGALTYGGQEIGSGNAFGKALVNAGDTLTGQLSEDLMTGTGYGMGSFGFATNLHCLR